MPYSLMLLLAGNHLFSFWSSCH